LQRPRLEALARSTPESSPNTSTETAILDVGALQFPDGHVRLGQVSRLPLNPIANPIATPIATPNINPMVTIDAQASEQWIRQAVGRVLPSLAELPATWHRCLVAFSPAGIALLGPIAPWTGFSLFTGFSSPFMYVPPLAQRYAQQLLGAPDVVITQLKDLSSEG
jgi:glycine/D-amino acid oxidase-like deaminating enzyme